MDECVACEKCDGQGGHTGGRHEDDCGSKCEECDGTGMVGPLVDQGMQQIGLPYGIIDPDYARIFTKARVLAWAEGYAITMHGSFTRDLDLLAVPWADRVCEPAHLVRRIEAACGLKQTGRPPSEKPHGRLAWTLLFPEFGDPRFVDLSVMTSQPATQEQAMVAAKAQPDQPSQEVSK